jgi:hypothetical protein
VLISRTVFAITIVVVLSSTGASSLAVELSVITEDSQYAGVRTHEREKNSL